MSQDGKTFNVNSLNSQTVGVVTIAIGFAVLISAYMIPRDNLWLVIPMVMLEVGIYGLGMAYFKQLRGVNSSSKWGNDFHYTLFWSSMVTVVGVMWLVYDQIKDANLIPAFIAVFLFYFGIMVMLMSRNKTSKTRAW